MVFPRQEYWSGLPPPSPGDLPNPGIKSRFSYFAGTFFTTEPPGKPPAWADFPCSCISYYLQPPAPREILRGNSRTHAVWILVCFTTSPNPNFHKTFEKYGAVKNQTHRSKERTLNIQVIKHVSTSRFFSSSQVGPCGVTMTLVSIFGSKVQRLDFSCFQPSGLPIIIPLDKKKNSLETNKKGKSTCLLKTCCFLWLSQGQGAQGT